MGMGIFTVAVAILGMGVRYVLAVVWNHLPFTAVAGKSFLTEWDLPAGIGIAVLVLVLCYLRKDPRKDLWRWFLVSFFVVVLTRWAVAVVSNYSVIPVFGLELIGGLDWCSGIVGMALSWIQWWISNFDSIPARREAF